MTNQADWERLQDLFAKAVELPAVERDAFVLRETIDDPNLRNELLALLECDSDASTSPITRAMGVALDATIRERREALVGEIIGNYRIVSVLGYGGTGTVYLAERADQQYSAQVAIKVVDTAKVHGDLGARFRAERQILASLDHPNISRLLDAGETDEGQPYLVLEYIRGEQLDRFADRQSLNLRRRLQLFLEICGAVHYAHQNLVVHRDLKPANILVTADGTPKLLDFGIAKLLDSADSANILALTRINDRLLTPEYASPEQILGQSITTASDIYALGIILYQLLTGLHPYNIPTLANDLELERLICTNDPERPSAAIRRLNVQADPERVGVVMISQARGLSPKKMGKRLQGDLDAIVMRALRKEPELRYGTVEQFAADIRRYLGNEPVHARQGSWRYYSQRFVRRHALGVSAAATFVIVGIAFLIATTIQTQRIAAERDRATQESSRAETVSDFMIDVFSASDPFTSQSHETTARELLDRASKHIKNDLTEQPEVRARLLEVIGKTYRRQGELEQARRMLDEAVHLRMHLSDPGGLRRENALLELAITQTAQGAYESAQKSLRAAELLAHEYHTEHSATYAAVQRQLGLTQFQNGNMASARIYLEKSLALSRELFGPINADIADILSSLSSVATWEDDLPAAEKLEEQALSVYERIFADGHPDRISAEIKLAQILFWEGRVAEAVTRYDHALPSTKVLYGENSRPAAIIYMGLADAKAAQDQLAAAEAYARKSLSAYVRSLGDEHYQTGFARASLAYTLTQRNKLKEAESLLRHSLETYSRTLPPDHQYVASSEYFLGELLLREGRLSEAELELRTSMDRWKRSAAPAWRVFRSQSALGEVLYRQHRYKEAERYLVESFNELVSDAKAERSAQAQARERIARFYQERGQLQKLRELARFSFNSVNVAVN